MTSTIPKAPDQRTPDRGEAEKFLAALTGDAAAPVMFQTFTDVAAWREAKANDGKPWPLGKDGTPRDPLAAWRHGTLDGLWSWLVTQNQAGAGIYVMVNQGDGKGRSAANVTGLRALFAEDDSGELAFDALAFTPSMVVASKNGLHVYWRLKPGEAVDAFKPAQKAIAKRLGTDPAVNDPSRVLRVPGFAHQKDPAAPFRIRLLQTNPRAYTIAEVLAGLGATIETKAEPLDLRQVAAALPSGPPSVADEVSAVYRIQRAQAWIAKREPAAEGGRNPAAFQAAAVLVRDFALSTEEAHELLRPWNRTNRPPLDDGELRQTIENAAKYANGAAGTKGNAPPRVTGGSPSAPAAAKDPDIGDLTIGAILGREVATIERGVPRIPTGWERLDAALGGGVELPSMTVLGAAPKSSKSTWAGIVAERHVAAGGVAYVLDIENGARRVLKRILCRRARLGPSQVAAAMADHHQGVFASRAQVEEWEAAKRYVTTKLAAGLIVETRPPKDLDARLRQVQDLADGRPVLMVVDSLQRLPMEDMSDRRGGIDRWIDLIEALTKDHKLASLLISEIKRDPSGGYKVGEAAFKESSRIEYAADLLLTMARPSIDDDDPEKPSLLRVEAARDVETDPRGPVASYKPEWPIYGLNEIDPVFDPPPEKPNKGKGTKAAPVSASSGLRA